MGKVIFLHPDLGIGGAERLVVDAALALTNHGHEVQFYTNHYDSNHCFEETKNLSVNVIGSFIPRSFLGRCRALFAYLRFAYAALYLAFFVIPKEYPDVIFCDIISLCVPLLKIKSGKFKVIFYCHYPDKLLTNRETILKKIYRAPIDWLEELTTKRADKILVNSKFTREVFKKSFPSIQCLPDVCYPSMNTRFFEKTSTKSFREVLNLSEDKFVFLSINRYERKKNLALALKSLNALKNILEEKDWKKVHLIMAGGYDSINNENIEHYEELCELLQRIQLNEHVTFLRSPSDSYKHSLLKHCNALIYTPSNEHFGIVPLEAMYFSKPVIAVNSGGPTETVVNSVTGFLCEANEDSFAVAMKTLMMDLKLSEDMGLAGKNRFENCFSFEAFALQLNKIIEERISVENMKEK